MKAIKLSIVSILLLSATLLVSFKCRNTAPKANNINSVGGLISQQQFNALFPMHDKFYSYAAFITAVNQLGDIRMKITRRAASVYQFIRTDKHTGKTATVRQDGDWNEAWAKAKPDSSYLIDYGKFCTEKDIQTNKKELAAFFAQISHETRHGQDGQYNDGLMFTHELNTSLTYISDNDEYPAVKGKKYYGRGPMQLSYNGNYGYASDCIFGDKKVLLNNPDLVQTDPVVAFKTGIYFWMTPQTNKPSAHDVMIGKWQPRAPDRAKGRIPGFGMTTNIINGEVECNKGDNMQSMNDRIGFYKHFLKLLGTTDNNCACSCGKMQPY
jgi:basic endochitinase B